MGGAGVEYISRFLSERRQVPVCFSVNLTLSDLVGEGVRSSLLLLTPALGVCAKF